MASIALELSAEAPGVEIDVVPGVTAALAAAAAVGAPLGHDHCAISLSDLLTPWEVIERRLRAAADGDFVVALYNPRSRGRDWQLPRAVEILADWRPPTTPVAVVSDVGRPEERVALTTLAQFDPATVGMTTCVVIGSSTTRMVGGRMVTPRGYQP
jgi:cobalt-precorrin 5A hydrolase/precorrin-3B C17-methyltransferase